VRVALVEGSDLADSLEGAGHEVVALESFRGAETGVTAKLSGCLVEFERRLGAEHVDTAIVCAADDANLALTLVAAKLGVHLARAEDLGTDAVEGYGRAIAVLCDQTLRPGAEPTIPGS
jgi:hypothetical protein